MGCIYILHYLVLLYTSYFNIIYLNSKFIYSVISTYTHTYVYNVHIRVHNEVLYTQVYL